MVKKIMGIGMVIVLLCGIILMGVGCRNGTEIDCLYGEDCNGACNFELAIELEENIMPLGKAFRGNIEFRNVSGQDIRVGYFFFWPAITETTWNGYFYEFVAREIAQRPSFVTIPKDENMRLDNVVLALPEINGVHQLQLGITFYTNWRNWAHNYRYRIQVLSNTIEIAVLYEHKGDFYDNRQKNFCTNNFTYCYSCN